jgi:hypothetical protein
MLFDYICENEQGFQEFFYEKRRKLFLVEYFWKEKIDYIIVKEKPQTYYDLYDKKVLGEITKKNPVPYSSKLDSIIRNKNSKKRQVNFNRVENLLVSPCCSSDMKINYSSCKCLKCNFRFPVNNLIVNLSSY